MDSISGKDMSNMSRILLIARAVIGTMSHLCSMLVWILVRFPGLFVFCFLFLFKWESSSWLIKKSLLSTDFWQPLEIQFLLVAGLSSWNNIWNGCPIYEMVPRKRGFVGLFIGLYYAYTKPFWTWFNSSSMEEITLSWQDQFSELLAPLLAAL